MKKNVYFIIAVQTVIMIGCILFSVLKMKEANMYRSSNVELENEVKSEKQKSEKIMLDYLELQKEFATCCQR